MASAKISDFERPKRATSFFKTRHLIALLATLCPVVCYISRQNLSMAIVAMVHVEAPPALQQQQQQQATTTTSSGANSNISLDQLAASERQPGDHQAVRLEPLHDDGITCPRPLSLAERHESAPTMTPASGHHEPSSRFHWSSNECNLVLGAFFWTYVIFQIPAARFAEQLGAKWILAAATIGSSALSLLSPWCASISVYGLFVARALMGICQTALYPACYVLYSQWLPPMERSQALPILSVGAYLGSIVASTSTGYFIQEPAYGWRFAFYMPGVLCALWSLAWLAYGSSEPRQHKSISLEEIHYIESKMELKRAPDSSGDEPTSVKCKRKQKKQISWSKLAKSSQIWAMIAAFFASNWSFAILMLLLPTYLNDILHVEPLDNGMINSTIYILFCIATPIVGSISTMMVETRPFGISRLNVRKLFQGLALFGQSLCFGLLPLIGCQTKLVVATLFMQIILFSCVNGGEVQLPTELSVDFSGTIYAIGNCIGSSTGFIVPAVRSLIIANEYDRAQWNQFFYVAALVSSLGASVFMVFGRNDLLDYSKDSGDYDENDKHCHESSKTSSSDSINKLKIAAQISSHNNLQTTLPSAMNIYKPQGNKSKFSVQKSQQLFESSQMNAHKSSLKCEGLACKSWKQRPLDIESGRQTMTMTTQW